MRLWPGTKSVGLGPGPGELTEIPLSEVVPSSHFFQKRLDGPWKPTACRWALLLSARFLNRDEFGLLRKAIGKQVKCYVRCTIAIYINIPFWAHDIES